METMMEISGLPHLTRPDNGRCGTGMPPLEPGAHTTSQALLEVEH